MPLHESGQMYLETIYILLKQNEKIRAIDIGAYLKYTKPSVSRAIGILKKNNYIQVDVNGYITLTKAGNKIAEELYERHVVLSNMLIALGVDEKTATDDACRIEHVVSDKAFLAIKQHYLNYKKEKK